MTGRLCHPAALPKLSPQHCLRTRFNGSSCTLCLQACPRDLPLLDGLIAIDATVCSGCLLCAAACPSGAIEPQLAEPEMTAALDRLQPMIVACQRASEECHLRIPCVGFLAEEYLLALQTAATAKVNLIVSHCGQCENFPVVNLLRARIQALELKTGLPVGSKIALVDSPADLHFQHDSVDRRGFFTTLTRSLLREATAVLSPPALSTNTPASYAKKHLPLRRKFLNSALSRISEKEQRRITALLSWDARRSTACDGCGACTKVCPTGAVSEKVSSVLEFDASTCTG